MAAKLSCARSDELREAPHWRGIEAADAADHFPGVGRCASNPGLNDGTPMGFSVSAYGAGIAGEDKKIH